MTEILSIGRIAKKCPKCNKLTTHDFYEIAIGDRIVSIDFCYLCGTENKEEKNATK